MEHLAENLESIGSSLALFTPELTLLAGFVAVLIAGLAGSRKGWLTIIGVVPVAITLYISCRHLSIAGHTSLFAAMLSHDTFGTFMKILFNVAALFTLWMSWTNKTMTTRYAEYLCILLGTLIGAHLLVMSINFIMVFISLELVSLGSYVLAGYAFNRKGSEGSFKYFIFGSVASAIMLYGFSFLYGLTGTLTFTSTTFADQLSRSGGAIAHIASLLAIAGFLYKIAAAPMHPWSPDVYEAAPLPVVAYFSVVPKLAGLAVLIRFTQVLHSPAADSLLNWQNVLALIAILSITVGNFSALWQQNPRRLMAYSSIAQTGFLLVGVVAVEHDGVQLAMFYATVYLAANFLVFLYLQFYETEEIQLMESFSGIGRSSPVQSIFLLVGLIALTGLPPTAGFTAKLFVFSSLWEAYAGSGKILLLLLLVFGLLNAVVSLFYYIRIPYYAFVRPGARKLETNILTTENLFGLVIVVIILGLFFNPGVLMGWINKINFAP